MRFEKAYLRAELTARSRELAAERERADVLMRGTLGRFEALTAGQVIEAREDALQTRYAAQVKRSPATSLMMPPRRGGGGGGAR